MVTAAELALCAFGHQRHVLFHTTTLQLDFHDHRNRTRGLDQHRGLTRPARNSTHLKVDVVDGVAHVLAPVADLVLLEARPAALREAVLAAERLGQRRRLECEQLRAGLLAPGAHDDGARGRFRGRRRTLVCSEKRRDCQDNGAIGNEQSPRLEKSRPQHARSATFVCS